MEGTIRGGVRGKRNPGEIKQLGVCLDCLLPGNSKENVFIIGYKIVYEMKLREQWLGLIGDISGEKNVV